MTLSMSECEELGALRYGTPQELWAAWLSAGTTTLARGGGNGFLVGGLVQMQPA